MTEFRSSKSSEFKIRRHEDKMSGAVTFQLSGPFTVRNMYKSVAPVTLHGVLGSKPNCAQPAVHIFDLTQVPYMDSAALGMIVNHCRQNRGRGIRTIATGVGPRVLERIRNSNMENLLPIAASA